MTVPANYGTEYRSISTCLPLTFLSSIWLRNLIGLLIENNSIPSHNACFTDDGHYHCEVGETFT